ncbi:PEBP-like protein [Thozetella sp. PMI_491]|nr:PEBP-like protein [Thozetella sp. PMI_491]
MIASYSLAASAVVALSNVSYVLGQTPSGFSPSINKTLAVSFGGTPITTGGSVALDLTQASPAVTLPKLSTNSSSYVLLMIDLDAPGGITGTDHSYAPFLHWLTASTAASTELPANETSTSDVAPYVGPAPPTGTGKHRYVFLLFSAPTSPFQWPSSVPTFDATKLESRIQFAVDNLATAGQLQLVAANWFTTENVTADATTGGSTSKNTSTPVYTADASGMHSGELASAFATVAALVAVTMAYL